MVEFEIKVLPITDEEFQNIQVPQKLINIAQQEDFKQLVINIKSVHENEAQYQQIEWLEAGERFINVMDTLFRYWYGSSISENNVEYYGDFVFYSADKTEEEIVKALTNVFMVVE